MRSGCGVWPARRHRRRGWCCSGGSTTTLSEVLQAGHTAGAVTCTSPGKDNQTIAPEGLRASELSPTQQQQLLDLVREWVGIANDAHASARMEEIRAKLPETYFAWSGPTTPGSAAYFRVQGPTLVIEYAPQRDTDHIHTIYRDPTNDYGVAFVRK